MVAKYLWNKKHIEFVIKGAKIPLKQEKTLNLWSNGGKIHLKNWNRKKHWICDQMVAKYLHPSGSTLRGGYHTDVTFAHLHRWVFKQRLSLGFDYCHLHVIYLVDEASGDELVKEEEVPRVTQHIPCLSVYILQLARCWFLLVWTLQNKIKNWHIVSKRTNDNLVGSKKVG